MRRIAVPVIACTLALVGCSGEKNPSSPGEGHRPLPAPTVSVSHRPVPPAVATDANLPKAAGRFGHQATITIPNTSPSGEFVVTPIIKGDGPTVGTHDIAVVNYTARTWKKSKYLPSTYKGSGHRVTPVVFAVGKDSVLPALDRAVQGQRVGSRILVVAPPAAAYGTSGNPGIGVSPTDTVVFAVDLVDAVDAKATVKREQHDSTAGLPGVRASSSTVSISVPDTAPPNKLISRQLVDGTGPTVRKGQTIVLRRAGAVWGTNRGKEQAALFDASWSHGPAPVVSGRHNLLEGLDRALIGTRSRPHRNESRQQTPDRRPSQSRLRL